MKKKLNINKPITLIYFNNLILGELRKNGIDCWIAGGCLRDYFSQKQMKSDCDIFFPNNDEYQKTKNYLINNGANVIWESNNGMKVTYKGNTFDLIKIFASNPKDTISRFDFTISMFATDGKDIYQGINSLKDLEDSKLVINTIISPLSTLKRVLKHYRKGFTMSAEETKKLYTALNNLPYDDKNDLLNVNGRSSGESIIKTNTTNVNTPEPKLVSVSPNYLKYAVISGLALLIFYITNKKSNKT